MFCLLIAGAAGVFGACRLLVVQYDTLSPDVSARRSVTRLYSDSL